MHQQPKRRRLSKAERQEVYDKCGGHCAYCGEVLEIEDMQVDHIQPISVYGTDEMDNFLPACRSCNHYKSTFTLEKYREYVKRITETLYRDSVTYRNAVRYRQVIPCQHDVVFYFENIRDTPSQGR